jgi:hypothetical protein
MPDRERLSTALKRPLRAAVVFIGHAALAAVVLAGIRLIEWLFPLLWGSQERKLFGWIPVQWPFDAADLGVLAVLAVSGTYEMYKKLKR